VSAIASVGLTCHVAGCNGDAARPGTARGYCVKHYNRWRRHGSCQASFPCTRPAVSHIGLCEKHLPAGVRS
jgi:hypothetical protein